MTDNNPEKAFDFAADVVKQLITLAAGIVTITIAFAENIIGSSHPHDSGVLLTAWILFALSIVFGLWSLMAMTGSLGKTDGSTDDNNEEARNNQDIGIYRKNIRIPAGLQIFLFIIGLGFAIAYGFISIQSGEADNNRPDSPIIIHSTEYRLEDQRPSDTLDVKANIVIK